MAGTQSMRRRFNSRWKSRQSGSPGGNAIKGSRGAWPDQRESAKSDLWAAGRRRRGLSFARTSFRKPAGGLGWPFKVVTSEMLGAERLVHGVVGAQPFTVRVDATLPAPRNGDTLTLQGAAEQLHWFDAATQQRL